VLEHEMKVPEDTDPGVISFVDASSLLQELQSNYGHMGVAYAKLLASNPAGIKRFVMDVMESLRQEVAAKPAERRWIAGIGTMLAGAMLANKIGAKFDTVKLRSFLVKMLIANRIRCADENVQGGTVSNTEEILSGFLKTYNANAVWTENAHMKSGRPGKNTVITVLKGPPPDRGNPIYVHWIKGERVLRIERNEFVKYLTVLKISPRVVLNGLREHYRMEVTKGRLAANTSYRCGPQNLLQLPVMPGSMLDDLMNAHGEPADDLTPPPVALTPQPGPSAPASPSDRLSAALTLALPANEAALALVRKKT